MKLEQLKQREQQRKLAKEMEAQEETSSSNKKSRGYRRPTLSQARKSDLAMKLKTFKSSDSIDIHALRVPQSKMRQTGQIIAIPEEEMSKRSVRSQQEERFSSMSQSGRLSAQSVRVSKQQEATDDIKVQEKQSQSVIQVNQQTKERKISEQNTKSLQNIQQKEKQNQNIKTQRLQAIESKMPPVKANATISQSVKHVNQNPKLFAPKNKDETTLKLIEGNSKKFQIDQLLKSHNFDHSSSKASVYPKSMLKNELQVKEQIVKSQSQANFNKGIDADISRNQKEKDNLIKAIYEMNQYKGFSHMSPSFKQSNKKSLNVSKTEKNLKKDINLTENVPSPADIKEELTGEMKNETQYKIGKEHKIINLLQRKKIKPNMSLHYHKVSKADRVASLNDSKLSMIQQVYTSPGAAGGAQKQKQKKNKVVKVKKGVKNSSLEKQDESKLEKAEETKEEINIQENQDTQEVVETTEIA